MNFRCLYPLGLLALLAGLPGPAAQAQTARIAHFSHGGSLETLGAAEALDNFGLGAPTFIPDSIRLISDTTAVEYGRWHWGRGDQAKEKVRTYQYASRTAPRKVSAKRYIEQETSYRPQVKVVGYDTIPKPSPALKKQKTKRKKSAFLPTAPRPPRHPGVALAVAAILLFAGAGWLLGECRPGAQPQAA